MTQIIGLIILASMVFGAFYSAKTSGDPDILHYFSGAVMGFVASVIMILMLSLVVALLLGAL